MKKRPFHDSDGELQVTTRTFRPGQPSGETQIALILTAEAAAGATGLLALDPLEGLACQSGT
jgi:hypothetical protein